MECLKRYIYNNIYHIRKNKHGVYANISRIATTIANDMNVNRDMLLARTIQFMISKQYPFYTSDNNIYIDDDVDMKHIKHVVNTMFYIAKNKDLYISIGPFDK